MRADHFTQTPEDAAHYEAAHATDHTEPPMQLDADDVADMQRDLAARPWSLVLGDLEGGWAA